ncbi:hypothetical protein MBSD_n2556 [Mizugakiibacter sediminis]|uniref:Uncharacterized protein n=1 Tax=Mizugakiibacter sediminis TaxID=1475481 RepID=A0A0K8QQS0_9GAMM|nr:hypothetical protein MBSD_n2556 [Mizugakiibacter sediminis]
MALAVGLLASVASAPTFSQTVSGGPCANFYASGFQLPQGQVDAAVPNLARPAKGAITTDPVFGTCVVRATQHDVEPPTTFARNDYSRREPFNADMSYFFVYSDGGYWHLYDANTLKYIKVLNGPAGDAELQWDPVDPKKLYFTPTNGGLKLYAMNVDTGAITTVADFTGKLPWPSAAHVWTKSEGSPSRDGRYWGLMVDDANWNSLGLIVWDTVQNRLVGSMSTNGNRPDHISMSPSGRWVVPSWLDGTYAYTPDFSRRVQLHHSSEHSDLGVLPNGDDVYVSIDFQANLGDIFMVDLDTGVRTDLMPTYISGSATALHVSMKAFNKPGWALIGTYAGTGPHRWYMDHLFALELKANPRIYNIAFHHSNVAGYWSEPQAAVNRDFTRILFNSNWGSSSDTDVDAYMVQLPAGAVPASGLKKRLAVYDSGSTAAPSSSPAVEPTPATPASSASNGPAANDDDSQQTANASNGARWYRLGDTAGTMKDPLREHRHAPSGASAVDATTQRRRGGERADSAR